MRCYRCNSLLDDNDYCLKCGTDVSVYKVVVRASNTYYNQGLARAQVRDLTGAVQSLRTSISINKNNVKARNLLGLVYYEMGEVVMALTEWVISKNIKPERNVAGVYIDKVQAEPNKLEAMNQAIKKFNLSLQYAKDGNCDMALIQLKKVVNMNPKLIKAGLLLALLFIRNGEKERARKTLNKVIAIDRNNTTALRYLDEINGTGIAREKDDDGIVKKRRKGHIQESVSGHDVILPPNSYKEPSSGVFTVLSILLGVVIGAAMIWYLVVPAKLANINYDNNQTVLRYSELLAANAIDIANLKSQIEDLETERDTLSLQYSGSSAEVEMYVLLTEAANAYVNNNFAEALVMLEKIDIALLPTQTAKEVYSTMLEYSSGGADRFKATGVRAYMDGDYESAISYLAAATIYNSADDEAVYYLGISYEAAAETDSAIACYQSFLQKFPTSAYLPDVTARLNTLVPPAAVAPVPEETTPATEVPQ